MRAVDGVDLQVPAGSVYGVLGADGAGRTTTTRMLATLRMLVTDAVRYTLAPVMTLILRLVLGFRPEGGVVGARAFVRVNPVTRLTDAVRGLMFGHPDGGATLWVLGITVALTAVFGPLTMRAYRNRR